MGIFDWLTPSPKNQSHFLSGDGFKWTPNEFGKMFVSTAIPNAEIQIEILFSDGKLGNQLPLARPVLSDVMPAKLYFVAFQVAFSLVYPIEILGVNDDVSREILSGITDELKKIRKPDGSSLSADDVSEINKLISGFFDFIITDSKELETENQEPPRVTQMLLSLIVMRYNNGGLAGERALEKMVKEGYYSNKYSQLTNYISKSRKAPLDVLGGLKIAYQV